ncbi:gliding motility-associated ABC transporter permease subunit GldF [Fulvivirga kasyanovii]|uniref:Gliding motility-associated ABC transporter permease subunit GldF n=1 Tax=Fulvivirga kasyanovii TaxID=396812 RepID=A0ABW9RVA3_9BACT|nr:gliding motility-associated ABC transporter permease subunit GldF [Fulvivirga kasyanovii]MTI27928.1 gliding motility-associated ABC transporter permease subunit GldF [Fulvivirga kasyanovii]
MIQVFVKELNSFLNSLIAYIVISVFLTGIGLLMWVFPETSVLEYGYADMETLFSLGPYVFMFLIPAITMRMFAEEKKAGTIELLITKPLTDWEIIFGKYLSGFALVVFSIIPTLIYYWSVYQLGNPVGNIDTAGVMGSYIGLILLGGVFTAIGIFSSAISTNQIVSFIIAVFFCFIVYSGFESIAAINDWGSFSSFIEQLGILYHYDAMSKGLVDTRDVIYFLSVIAVMLLSTKLILSSRKW